MTVIVLAAISIAGCSTLLSTLTYKAIFDFGFSDKNRVGVNYFLEPIAEAILFFFPSLTLELALQYSLPIRSSQKARRGGM